MKRAIVLALFCAALANAGVIRYSAKTAYKATKFTAKTAAKGAKLAAKVVY